MLLGSTFVTRRPRHGHAINCCFPASLQLAHHEGLQTLLTACLAALPCVKEAFLAQHLPEGKVAVKVCPALRVALHQLRPIS